MILLKKRLEIIVYHLGYGGIEKAVSSLANLLNEEVEISILSFYRLYQEPIFSIPYNVSIHYLYDTDVPLKVKKYNQLLHQGKIFQLFASVFQDYVKGFHFLALFHDLCVSTDIYFLKGRYRRFKKYLKRTNADIYLSTRFEISQLLAKYGNKDSLKIGWEHNHHHGNLSYKNKVIAASKDLDYLVLVSRGLAKDYQDSLKEQKCRCVYIPNMIDYDLPFVSDYRDRNIVMIGRLEEEKGFFDAILVAKRLQEKQISFHLDIIGDGPLRNILEKHIQDKGLTSYIKIHGFQNHAYIEEIFHHSSLYLMTSYTESFGLVLLEAMNAGLPCLAFSSAEGACELIQNGSNGYLILQRNVDEMAIQIIELLDRKDELQRLGKNAKGYSKNYLPDSVRLMWRQLLEGGKS